MYVTPRMAPVGGGKLQPVVVRKQLGDNPLQVELADGTEEWSPFSDEGLAPL